MSHVRANSAPFEILKSAAEDGRVIISGPLIEIGALNLNKWGLEANEVDNYTEKVIGVPLRKCSGIEDTVAEHSCDYNWNPDDDIGRIIGASVRNGWINVTAEITDQIAQRKITDRTWDQKWSAFLAFTLQDARGMVTGTKPLSVTLVKSPAYGDKAGFKVQNQSVQEASMTKDKTYSQKDVDKMVAAAIEESTKDRLTQEDVDKLVSAAEDKADGKMKDMLSKEDADKLVAAAIEDMKKKEDDPADGETITKGEVAGLISAAVEVATEGSVPRADVEKMVAASVEVAKTQTIDKLKVETLAGEVVGLQVSAGIIKEDEAGTALEACRLKSAAVLEADKAMFGKVVEALASAGTTAVDKFRTAHIPTGGKSGNGFTVGNFNDGKDWSDS